VCPMVVRYVDINTGIIPMLKYLSSVVCERKKSNNWWQTGATTWNQETYWVVQQLLTGNQWLYLFEHIYLSRFVSFFHII